MPLNPAISLGVQPPAPPASPLQALELVRQMHAQKIAENQSAAQLEQTKLQTDEQRLKLAAIARQTAGIEARANAIKSTMKDGKPDYEAAAALLAADFPDVGADLLDAATKTAASRMSLLDTIGKLTETGREHRGELALALQTALKTSANPHDTLANYIALAAGDKVIPEDQARQLLQGAQQLPPDASVQQISQWADQFITPAIRKREADIAKAAAEAKKTAAETANLEEYGSLTPPSLQSENVMYGGKPVQVTFNPRNGKRTLTVDGADVDVTGKTTPIPPASIQISNAVAGSELPDWALTDQRPIGPAANAFNGTIGMTPNGLYQSAINWIQTGRFPPTGIGSSTRAQNQRSAITSKAGAIAAASGMDIPALQAFYKSNAASLTTQQRFFDSAQAFLSTADKNAELLEGTLAKIPDLGSALLNQPLRSISQKALGSVDVAQFRTYIASVQNEYAKILNNPNLSGQLTDSARAETQKLVDPNATVAQIIGSLQALRAEGDNRLTSIGEQIQTIQGRMSHSAPAAAAEPAATTPAAAKEGDTKPIPGYPGTEQTYRGGKWIRTK